MAKIADLLDLAAGELEWAQVPQVEVVVGAVGLQLVTELDEFSADSTRVGNNLSGVSLEGGVAGLLEGDSNAGNGL